MYVSLGTNEQIALPEPLTGTADLHASMNELFISPGIGYRLYASDKVGFDARVGFSYLYLNVNANFEHDPHGGASRTVDYVQPWIGERFTWLLTPKLRFEDRLALTGLGADGDRMGWSAYGGISYLVTKWFDVTLGYNGSQTSNTQPTGPMGQDRSTSVLTYGPVAAMGFRF